MDPPVTCMACHSDNNIVLPTNIRRNGLLGYGLDIEIDKLQSAAASGCQPCTLLSNFLQVFRKLSPSFETNYPGREPNELFVQNSHVGSLLVALGRSSTYVDHLELYSQIGCPSPWPAIGPAADFPETLTLELATKKIELWISNCQQHSCCTNSRYETPKMPTRILLIEKHKVSLQEAAGKRGIYATLSHCWGNSQVLTTTKETLEHRHSGIRWDSLPRVFQEAIALTKNLGIEYLWIDSLCIIQGDHMDWMRESASMAAIFSNSYLNIAATSSSASDGALFTKRWTTPVPYEIDPETLPKRPMKSYHIPFASNENTIKARYSTRSAHENVKMLHNSKQMKRSDVMQKGPLLTRSWVFQERLLSPRTVHFHASEMIWECRDSFICECGDLQEADHGMHDGNLIVGKLWLYEVETDSETEAYTIVNRWLDGVELYSRLRITNCTDKLPALAGLAERFAMQLKSPYLAGLWECDLPRSLCWKVVGEQKDGPETDTEMSYGKRCFPYCAPTWSWASIDLSNTGIESSFEARTAFEHLIVTGFVIDKRYKLIAAECVTHPESPFGQVISGMLKIRAAVISTILFFDDQYLDPDCFVVLNSRHYRADVDLDVEYLHSRKSSRRVEGCNERQELDIVLVLLGGIRGFEAKENHDDEDQEEELFKTTLALVLTVVAESRDRYERIGILECPGSGSDFLNANIRTIEII
ncbi:hypothetical protein BP6252_13939 [Coleophoma cylindrospora]|uniref:Heterokaryon incompatibility domain-containing protein n=1 Tax=Coleophoma cylindrospora TaxID=1849047 RepID=A0A3D8Q592_9HELO|nr:hypothetical protein BP6252_13939 [Coleophoma cylindrospora]